MIVLVSDFSGLIPAIFLLLFGPPILLTIIGLGLFKNKKQTAGKIMIILSGVYLIIGFVCGILMMRH
ncbi:hypothetical protein [Aquimarina sediminis]|uniref:hypothetical protein n=1 Tax=Aquimarina sediminis TaxID=2070536 RepID=UPI000CA01E2C|nr:hypothetical protein [Aquimarina sediminis]